MSLSLREWLEGCGCHDVVEVEVKIGRTTYEGCRYKQNRETPEGSRSRREGRTSYVQEALYLLGNRPPVYMRSANVVFVIGGDSGEWYLASWHPVEVARDPKFADAHYDGRAAYQLMPWRHDTPIDSMETVKYRRVKITLRVMDPV